MRHGLSCSEASGIFPDRGLNLCLLHWQAFFFFFILTTESLGKPLYLVLVKPQLSHSEAAWLKNHTQP